MTAAKL